jgi:predicted TIM-barrel fold metal-dependent hydrolase
MKRIDFEAHFYTKDFLRFLRDRKEYPKYRPDHKTQGPRMWYTPGVSVLHGDNLLNKLLALGEARLEQMDAAGIDVQVLSLSEPGCELFDPEIGTPLAREANDSLAEVIKKFPDRFVAFAALAPKDAKGAVKELERTVRDLGFKGWKTHSNYGDSYLDDERYWPVLETVEELDVPVYLHPAFPAIPQLFKYGVSLAAAPFGFGFETAMCMMRLILSGVFDRFPRLRIILGHLGEALPFLMTRMDFPYIKPWFNPDDRPKLERKPSVVLKENVYVTTSGNYYEPAFMCTFEAMGIDRILLGTDYPYEDPAECLLFLEGLPIRRGHKEKIFHLNASRMGIGS